MDSHSSRRSPLRARDRQPTSDSAASEGSSRQGSRRSELGRNLRTARQNLLRARTAASGRRRAAASRTSARTPSTNRKSTAGRSGSASGSTTAKKPSGLSKLLSPKNIQQSLKTVGSLRNVVKNWLQYLQQADQVLDTFYVTSNSLKETGVLDKIVKSRGKNLTSEDFTNVLVALMNSPMGSQLLRSIGGRDKEVSAPATSATPAAPNPAVPESTPQPGAPAPAPPEGTLPGVNASPPSGAMPPATAPGGTDPYGDPLGGPVL